MRRLREQPKTTIAILGSDTVVGRTLCVLLEGHGYNTILLDSHPTGVVEELLEGAHLLLMTPRLDEDLREAFIIGAKGKSDPQKGGIPVIALSTTPTAKQAAAEQEEGVVMVPWPCEIEYLVEQIEAALLEAPRSSTSPTTQAETG